MPSFTFNQFKGLQNFNYNTDTIMAMLVTVAPNRDADTLTDASITELGTTITTTYARVTLANKSVVVDDTADEAQYIADPIDFGALATGETVLGAIVYKLVTDDTDSVPLTFLEIATADRATNGEVFKLKDDNNIVFRVL